MPALKQLDSASTQISTKPKLKIVRRHGQAKRLVETRTLSHTDWLKANDSQKLDTRQLKIDHPALYEAYLKPQIGSRRFLVQAA